MPEKKTENCPKSTRERRFCLRFLFEIYTREDFFLKFTPAKSSAREKMKNCSRETSQSAREKYGSIIFFRDILHKILPSGQNSLTFYIPPYKPHCCLGRGFDTFKTCLDERPIWNLENALSTEGKCVAYPVGVQLFLLIHYLGTVPDTFKTCLEERPFWELENVLSPEGRCTAYPVGVQLFLLIYYLG